MRRSSVFSSGASSSAIASFSAPLSAAPSCGLLAFAQRLRPAPASAATPQSACSSAVSSSSYSASSILRAGEQLGDGRVERRRRVRASPALRRAAQESELPWIACITDTKGESVRIIAGEYRGRRIAVPERPRPAADARPRARDAVQLARPVARRARVPRSFRRQRRARLRGRLARRGARGDGRAATARSFAGAAQDAASRSARAQVEVVLRRRVRVPRARSERFDVVFLDPPVQAECAAGGVQRAAAGLDAGRARVRRSRASRSRRASHGAS